MGPRALHSSRIGHKGDVIKICSGKMIGLSCRSRDFFVHSKWSSLVLPGGEKVSPVFHLRPTWLYNPPTPEQVSRSEGLIARRP